MASRIIYDGHARAWCLALGALAPAGCGLWPAESDTPRTAEDGSASGGGPAATATNAPMAASSVHPDAKDAAGSPSSAGDAALPRPPSDAAVLAPVDATVSLPADGAVARNATSLAPGDGAAPREAAVPVRTGDAAVGNASGGWWRPAPGTTWQWQLQGTLDTTLNVAMYDIDMFETSPAVIAALQKRGVVVVCYVDVGTWEPGRPDASEFPAAVLGHPVTGWPGEKWLDVRASAVRTIMESRFTSAKQKGCQGIEPDNVDGYENTSGFPLTAADQIAYDTWVAGAVHALGMAVGLKNDVAQVGALQPFFDFELDEQCFANGECSALGAFVDAGKAVFEVEYGTAALATSICPQATARRFDALIKRLALDAWRVPCE